MKKILIVNSAKGGVGKTEVSTGIAKALKNKGHSVAMLDLDVTTPNVERMEGIEVHSSSSRAEKSKTQIKKLISSVIKNSDAEYIIIDTPPTIGSTYMAITETIENPKFLFVTTPSKNAVLDTSSGVKFFASRGYPPAGIIQNMTGSLFGDRFDSDKAMGVATVGEIPFTDNRTPYFEELSDFVESMDFKEGNVKASANKEKILSTLTLNEARNSDIEPAFYNLETWPYFQEKLIKIDQTFGGALGKFPKSRFSVSVEKLKGIIEAGESADVMVMGSVSVEHSPIPYEIQEAKVMYDHKFAKGLPMLVLNNGVSLWPDEISLVDDSTTKEALDLGGVDLGNGRILQSLFQTLYLCRAFGEREDNTNKSEQTLVAKYIDTSGIEVSAKEIVYAIYKLENDGNDEFDVFNYNEYILTSKKEFPEFGEHLERLASIVGSTSPSEKVIPIESAIEDEQFDLPGVSRTP